MSAYVDDLLRDLRVELEAAAPAPGFRHRVKAFALQSARRRCRPAPIALAAAVVVILASRMLVPFSTPATGPSAVPLAAPRHVAELDAAPPQLTTPAARQNPRVRSSSRVRSNPQTTPRFEVIVPPDQEIALRQWLNSLRAARQPEAVVATQTVPAVTLVQISLIQIEPIPTSQYSGPERNR